MEATLGVLLGRVNVSLVGSTTTTLESVSHGLPPLTPDRSISQSSEISRTQPRKTHNSSPNGPPHSTPSQSNRNVSYRSISSSNSEGVVGVKGIDEVALERSTRGWQGSGGGPSGRARGQVDIVY